MRLNELSDNPGARHQSKRLGRGIGSGKGKTSGKGHKGAKARAGASVKGFEGGQMPIYRRTPKRGFKNPFAKEYQVVNLDRLQKAVDEGRLDPARPVTAASLVESGLVRRARDGIRLLGKGEITAALTIEVAGASQSAVAAVAAAGGTVSIIIVGGKPAAAAEGDAGAARE